MTVHALGTTPGPELARALAEFESQFVYPLGPGRSFRISHGEDYPRFFRAIGYGTSFVAEQGGRVLGTLGVAVCPVIWPDGGEQQVAYIGDLKIDPALRGSMVFLRLARAADAWARPQVSAAFGVVMDGTPASPSDHTGRLGIPSFLQLGKVNVLRIATEAEIIGPSLAVPDEQGQACYRALSRGRYAAKGGDPDRRSEMQPVWLVYPQGLACGRLEDTRRAKRLIASDGIEMKSAHLACFAWRSLPAAVELIHAARGLAADAGFPALFVALADADADAVRAALSPVDTVVAPATIYGAGFGQEAIWNINSSEI